MKRKIGTDKEILADWDTGKYSRKHGGTKTQAELAHKHRVSGGKVSKLIKDREPRMAGVVSKLVDAKQALAEENEETVKAVETEVEQRVRNAAFFNNASMIITKETIKRVQADDADLSMMDMRHASEIVARQKESVMGKQPEIALQVNNGNDADKPHKIVYEVIG
tara:strand:- start:698 stop:1192 length:495 start_codon:yes stop_codon:yes gene_type:complete